MKGHHGRLLASCCGFLFAVVPFSAGNPAARAADTGEIKVTPMERLNTPADEDDPHLAPDGLRFFYASKTAKTFDIWLAERKPMDTKLGDPKPVEELSEKTHTVSPCAAADGQYLYFARESEDPPDLPVERNGEIKVVFVDIFNTLGCHLHFPLSVEGEITTTSKRPGKNFDIFFTRRLNPREPYSRTAIAAVHQICTEDDELHPWLTMDGAELYFSRKTKDGWRIGLARRPGGRGAFDAPQLLDLPVGFHHPTVSRDGLTMYLQGPVGKDRLGLFVSRRASRMAPWGKPEALDTVNNADGPRGDCSPNLSPDGRFLYFASDRPGGKGGLDIYFVAMADLVKK